jgi:hypothetical protein
MLSGQDSGLSVTFLIVDAIPLVSPIQIPTSQPSRVQGKPVGKTVWIGHAAKASP